jgi:uncharacterized protein
MKKFGLILFFILFISFTSAQVPNSYDRYVNDFADILDTSTEGLLNSIFQIVELNTTSQVVFVSVANTSGYEISEYATLIGQEWGVGQSDVDNGVVILYVVDSGKIWVATGYGVEGILPDSKIGRMLDESYVPMRDEGMLQQGIVNFSYALAQELIEGREEIQSEKAGGVNWVAILILAIVIFMIIIYSINYNQFNRGRFGRRNYTAGHYSFGGSSGGGSFGGGSFGGGGAGR